MSKRGRSDSTPGSKKKLAQYLSIKEKEYFPRARYGKAFYERGTVDNVNRFGATWKKADAEQRERRQVTGYTGQGKYSVGKNWRKFVQSSVGRGLAHNITGIANAGAGLAERVIGKQGLYTGGGLYNGMSGMGSYHANVLMQGGRAAMHSSSVNDETQSLTFSHSEYIGDMYGPATSAFTNVAYRLNPGLGSIFPWLSQLAANYEEYTWKQLVFDYKSTVDPSNTNANGNTGTLILATNYNANAPFFGDKEQMMQYHGGVSGRLSDDVTHGVECDPSKSVGDMTKFIRTNPITGSTDDLKSYDHGVFQFAVANCPAAYNNQQIGELWVTYTVELTKPRLWTARGGTNQNERFIQAVASTISLTAPLGSSMLTAQQNNIGCRVGPTGSISVVNPSLFTPPAAGSLGLMIVFPASYTGTLRINYSCAAATLTTTPTSPVLVGNVEAVVDRYVLTPATGTTPAGYTAVSTSNYLSMDMTVRIRAATAGVDNVVYMRPAGTVVTSPGGAYLEITEENPGFNQLGVPASQPIFINSSGVITTPI